MTSHGSRRKPTSVIEGLRLLRPAFLVADTLSRFNLELLEAGTDEEGYDISRNRSPDGQSALIAYLDSEKGDGWSLEGYNQHVLELRAHYVRDPVAIEELEKIKERAKEPEVDPNIDQDEIIQPRWKLKDRVPQVGKTWKAARAAREPQAAAAALRSELICCHHMKSKGKEYSEPADSSLERS